MAGKDGKVEPKSGDVVRQGFMVKRSQNKKRFTPVNYKQRWFVLTRRYLVYYDGDGEVSVLSFFAISLARHILSTPRFYFSFHYRPLLPLPDCSLIIRIWKKKVGSISGSRKRFLFVNKPIIEAGYKDKKFLSVSCVVR